MTLPAIQVVPKSGAETFRVESSSTPISLIDYWRWAHSDLVVNTERGVLAEFIVARALGIDTGGVRREWDAFDLITRDGLKIEVKSAAYIQSWAQKDYSNINFTVSPRRGWSDETGLDAEPKRHADVYVLALLAHKDQETIDPLNLDQWQFFVVPAQWLNERERSQHSITLPSLEKEKVAAVGYAELAGAVMRAADTR